jgi:hypothetical protein
MRYVVMTAVLLTASPSAAQPREPARCWSTTSS